MSNHGLPASGRLLGSVDFNGVLSKRQRNSDQLFIVYAASNGLDRGRLGVTVSRKVSLRAVRRNRVKRLIRESFRHHPDIARGCDFVVIAKQATTSASNEDIIASLENHWSEAKARCGNS
ncbi:MAG: ribonuclease P protein component [Arenicellales bacterium]